MTIRSIRTAIQEGKLVLGQDEEIVAKSEFQRARLLAAVTLAKLYLKSGMTADDFSGPMNMTREGVQQKIRLGLNYMQKAGWLKPADPDRVDCSPTQRSSGRDQS